MQNSRYYPLGLTRCEQSAKKLIRDTPECGLENIWVCDVTKLNPQHPGSVPSGASDAEAMIICTSAVPRMRKRSLVKAFAKIPWNYVTKRKGFEFRSLEFYYDEGQYPEKVDYEGQKAQIDLAKKLGIPHVVLVR